MGSCAATAGARNLMLATDKFNSGGVGLQNAVLALPSGEVLLAPPGVAFSISGDDLGCDPGWPPEHRSRQAAHAWAMHAIGVGVGGQGVSCQCCWLANTPQRVVCRWLAILGLTHSGKRQVTGARSWPALRFQAGRTPGERKSRTKKLYTKMGCPAGEVTVSYKKRKKKFFEVVYSF